jgi:hypothetical protein
VEKEGYRGVPLPSDWIYYGYEQRNAWHGGVDAALAACTPSVEVRNSVGTTAPGATVIQAGNIDNGIRF